MTDRPCPTCGHEDDETLCQCQIDEWLASPEGRSMHALYKAEKAAGLLRPQAEIDEELRQAGRGHLVRR